MTQKPGKAFVVVDLLDEARMTCSIVIVAIAKRIHEHTGQLSGEFPCPRCNHGIVKWSVAPSNGHARVCCSRRYTGEDGKLYYCTQAME